eukprot:431610-Prymnesium_polylepis.1
MPHRPPPVPPRAICHGRPIPKTGVPGARRQRQFGESARDAVAPSRSAPAPPAGERQGRGSRSSASALHYLARAPGARLPGATTRPPKEGDGTSQVDTSPLPRTVRQRHPC